MSNQNENIDYNALKRAYERERKARKQAEKLLEEKSTQLYHANENLRNVNENLEQQLEERIQEIVNLAKFPEQNPNPVLRLNAELQILYYNPSAGFIKEELESEGEVFEQISINMQRTLFYGETKELTIKIYNRSYLLVFQPINDEGFVNIYGADITNLVNAQKKLVDNEERFRTLVESANDVIYQTDIKGNFFYVNPNAIKLSGYSGGEMLNMNFKNLVLSEYLDGVTSFYRKQIREGWESSYYEFPILSKQGEVLWFGQNVQPIIEEKKIVGFIAFARDITDRKQAQEELKRSEEKYRGVIENLNMGILEVNEKDEIIKAHPGFCELSGYSELELLGNNPMDLFLNERDRIIMTRENERREDGISGVYEVQIKCKNGDNKWVIISGAPFYDEYGKVIGSIGIHWDITDRKQMEDELLFAKQNAEKSLEIRQQFLANMSHEIRTPLNGIMGMANLLDSSIKEQKDRQYLEAIQKSSSNLLHIINDILDFSKIEANKLEFENEPFNLNEILDRACKLQYYKAEEKGISCRYAIGESVSKFLVGDSFRITQVVNNLLSNAVKFTHRGEVLINVELRSQKGDVQKLLFEVIDTGIGIAKEKLNTIFQSFSQEEQGTTRKYGGTGLGLSISKQIVGLMGGDLRVESEKNKGSRFYFEVKLSVCENCGKDDVKKIDRSSSIENVSVLLVDDNDVNVLMARSLLEKQGAIVDVGKNGKEALFRVAEGGKYDVILMDLQMPIMDGEQALRILLDEYGYKKPVIALTAKAIKGERERCLEMGFSDFITKPFKPDQLFEVIAENVSHNSLMNEVSENQVKEIVFEIEKNDNPEYLHFTLDKLIAIAPGDKNFIAKMLQTFIDTATVDLKAMRVHLNDNKLKEAGMLAHKIKPSIDYLSKSDLSEKIRQIEAFEREEGVLSLNDTLDVMDSLDELLAEVVRYVSDN